MEIRKLLSSGENDLARLNSKFWDFVSSRFSELPDESEDKKLLFSAFEESEFVGGLQFNNQFDSCI